MQAHSDGILCNGLDGPEYTKTMHLYRRLDF
jgi:hypothetical protein